MFELFFCCGFFLISYVILAVKMSIMLHNVLVHHVEVELSSFSVSFLYSLEPLDY